jgi:hypothetical protein
MLHPFVLFCLFFFIEILVVYYENFGRWNFTSLLTHAQARREIRACLDENKPKPSPGNAAEDKKARRDQRKVRDRERKRARASDTRDGAYDDRYGIVCIIIIIVFTQSL